MKDITISEVAVSVTKTFVVKLRVESNLVHDTDHLLELAHYQLDDAAEEFEISPLLLADKDEVQVLEIMDEWNDYED